MSMRVRYFAYRLRQFGNIIVQCVLSAKSLTHVCDMPTGTWSVVLDKIALGGSRSVP